MSFTYTRLDWDSRFFNLEIIVARQHIFNDQDIFDLAAVMQHDNINLAYFYATKIIDVSTIPGYELIKVDEKVTYLKDVEYATGQTPNVLSYTTGESYEAMLRLALESGKYSRFKVDRNFSQNQFERLYQSWLDQSIAKTMADEVLVYKKGDHIVGLVTLNRKNDVGRIGLLSVDHHHRNQGIGQTLMRAADNWYVQQKLRCAEVVTQLANKPACSLYERSGYRLKNMEHVYHFWRKTS